MSDFPVVFLCSAPVCDLIGWTHAAYFMAIAAVLFALPTAATGLWELAKLGAQHPAANLGLWHAALMGSAVSIEVATLIVRQNNHVVAMVLEFVAAGLVVVGGWCGGHLVFVHGVGRR